MYVNFLLSGTNISNKQPETDWIHTAGKPPPRPETLNEGGAGALSCELGLKETNLPIGDTQEVEFGGVPLMAVQMPVVVVSWRMPD